MKNNLQSYYEKDLEYRPSASRARKIRELTGDKFQRKRVLDVGCGSGDMGKILKNDGAYVVGIDLSERAVEKAKQVLDEARVVNIEEEWPVFQEKFDVVVASEIIEHLFYPEGLMQKIKGVLCEGGSVIITTPNFLVWSNRIKMLFGKFQYTDSGFLDRGHIHFYTYQTLVTDITNAGFTIVEENHIIHPKIPVWIGRKFPSLFAFQLILKATPR